MRLNARKKKKEKKKQQQTFEKLPEVSGPVQGATAVRSTPRMTCNQALVYDGPGSYRHWMSNDRPKYLWFAKSMFGAGQTDTAEQSTLITEGNQSLGRASVTGLKSRIVGLIRSHTGPMLFPAAKQKKKSRLSHTNVIFSQGLTNPSGTDSIKIGLPYLSSQSHPFQSYLSRSNVLTPNYCAAVAFESLLFSRVLFSYELA